jgi:hypothetical protein
MAKLQCLLCDTRFDRPANHFCARECRPGTGRHIDFCKPCRAACLKAVEPEIAESSVLDEPEDRLSR